MRMTVLSRQEERRARPSARAVLAFLSALALPLVAAPARTASPEDAAPAPATLFTASQLDQLVAPVALYPDVVLNSLLPASTAPPDVAAAAQYAASQGATRSGTAITAPTGVEWEPSVVALLQFPEVLAWMNENSAWVEQLGFAMTYQASDVLAAVQRYRAKARDTGALASNQYINVTTPSPSIIVIEPVRPEIVYVPVYDPWLIYEPGWV